MSDRLEIKGAASLIVRLTLILVCLTACVKRAHENTKWNQTAASNLPQATALAASNHFEAANANQAPRQRINLNSASATELETLPGVGKALAERIIEHREKCGPFRRPEHLIIVRGFSEKRFRTLRNLITVD